MTTVTASPKKIVDTAASQIGYHEGYSSGHWNNDQKYSDQVPGLEWSDGQPWCAVFVSWCAMKSELETLYPRTASCDVAGSWFKSRKQFSDYPAIGAQVFFGSRSDLNHTGLVVDYDDTYVYTIEGNTNDDGSREGDGVYRKKRDRRSSNIVGYGYPAFPEGIVSADPAWADRAPKETATATVRVTPRWDHAWALANELAHLAAELEVDAPEGSPRREHAAAIRQYAAQARLRAALHSTEH